jgi:hypothetical protein
MINKNFPYYLILVTISFIIISCIALAKEQKHNYIKFIVKEDKNIEDSIKEVIKKLNELARDMEKRAKIYNTINQKSYWESEAKKSFLKYLQSECYYSATIETDFVEGKSVIIFYINKGQRYKIKKLFFRYVENSNHNIKIPNFKK